MKEPPMTQANNQYGSPQKPMTRDEAVEGGKGTEGELSLSLELELRGPNAEFIVREAARFNREPAELIADIIEYTIDCAPETIEGLLDYLQPDPPQ